MKKVMLSLLLLVAFVTISACAPVTLQKCYTDYEYYPDGKLKQEYKECVTQVPEKLPALHPKHKDLYN